MRAQVMHVSGTRLSFFNELCEILQSDQKTETGLTGGDRVSVLEGSEKSRRMRAPNFS
jgi:hypothetical protein